MTAVLFFIFVFGLLEDFLRRISTQGADNETPVMFGRKRGGDSSAKRSKRDAESTARHFEPPSVDPDLSMEDLGFFNDNQNAKKAAAANKKGNAAGKPSAKPSQTKAAAPAPAPAPRPQPPPPQPPPPPQNQPPPPPPPPPPVESAVSLDVPLDSGNPSEVSTGKPIENGHDPEMIHRILTKIHFPAMHPMFLAENVAPAVLPTHLLTDHEMVTIFIDCLSRSPNKFGLFPCDKRWRFLYAVK